MPEKNINKNNGLIVRMAEISGSRGCKYGRRRQFFPTWFGQGTGGLPFSQINCGFPQKELVVLNLLLTKAAYSVAYC
ncbi:hypothetical protein [Sneathiella sp.]|uniref:hypothetical protein n=1 Tax=Sneathiella sp. TaxID=1964365 RepID=UPI0026213298|nr:hypothetical protein [Sneathiella sp.]MDF2365993.1 hypothetical protein [Sneathiella sp.]